MLLICIAGLFPVGASAGDDPKVPTLKGKWQIIDERLDKIGVVIVWEFTDTKVIVRDEKTGEEVSRFRYTIDGTKSPMWITVEVDDSPTEDSGDRRLGIFRIQGSELHLKQEISDGAERPAKFDGRFSRFQSLLGNNQAEQAGAGQPATRPQSKSEGNQKPDPETDGRSR
jgi:uncharacterized protein (TIGR03067 family)